MGVMYLFLFLSVVFFAIYFVRREKRGRLTAAKITKIDEGSTNVAMGYHMKLYFYPVIKYTYEIGGDMFKGEIDSIESRQYRVPEYDDYGFKNKDEAFFWRSLNVGDEIMIYVSERDNYHSWLSFGKVLAYKSETRGFLLISILTLLGSIVLFLLG